MPQQADSYYLFKQTHNAFFDLALLRQPEHERDTCPILVLYSDYPFALWEQATLVLPYSA